MARNVSHVHSTVTVLHIERMAQTTNVTVIEKQITKINATLNPSFLDI